MTSPFRPLLRWHGGKWMLAPWIISHFPPHRIYVEPYGGAGSVLMRKPRSYAEVWNDLDGDVVNLFRVLRLPDAAELVRLLRLTPFARDEFDAAYQPCDCPVERARRLVIRSFMGFGSNGHNRVTGFRANSSRSGTTPAHDWRNYPDSLEIVIERLHGVTIENRDAKAVMAQHDSPETLHYVDPPYVLSTRSDPLKDYAHEMSDEDHADLLEMLRSLSGMVVLSGYPCELYDDALAGWHRIEREALADGAAKRMEVLWINAACWNALHAVSRDLFAEHPPHGALAVSGALQSKEITTCISR
ncbi:DNA adenine methylase [Mesorhizobium sp. RMAD-H1]|uniref:DNA adenine methylase n=1 Tax=Mesorhizobium sp. RMAD-H1 TaxID=2587065 RepID=UPI00160C10F1|nr:DNA adenine methylase [Mesorhizobium sp. RMAD-H1]MBB2973970.1 DNA adenine methylase [Mesorhizobium sp. RMAD-H1]